MKLRPALCNLCVMLFAFVLFSCEDLEDEVMNIGDTEITMVCDGGKMVVFEVIADDLGIDWGDDSMQKGTKKGQKEKFHHYYGESKAITILVKGTNIKQLVYSADIIKVTVKKSPGTIGISCDPALKE
jgi:hypothetical protein